MSACSLWRRTIGIIAVNVCGRGGRLYESDRADIIRRKEHITAFCVVVSTELQFSLLIASWTSDGFRSSRGTAFDRANLADLFSVSCVCN